MVGVVLALVAVVAGCGRGGDAEEVTVVRELDVLEGVEATGSARVAVTVDLELEEPVMGPDDAEDLSTVRISGTGEGVMGFGADRYEIATATTFEGEGIADPAPGVVQHAEVRRIDGRMWTRVWNEDEEAGSWIETPVPAADDDDVFGNVLQDPSVILERLRDEARSFTEAGPDEVRGDATTRWRAEVDREAVDSGEGLWTDEDGDVVSVDVWIDDQDRLRRIEAGGLTLELWDFGVDVDVEVPADVLEMPGGPDTGAALDAMEEVLPQVEGEWTAQATGSTADTDWTVFSAPGSMDGEATTCRTFELAGDGPVGEVPPMVEDLPVAMHGATFATCGNGTVATTRGRFEAEPDVQILVPMADPPPALVAFVVAPGRAAGGIRLVRDGADAVELAVDASGVAVWDGTGSPGVTAVELDGGSVTCAIADLPGFAGGTDGGGFDPEGAMARAGVVLEPCTSR